MSKQWFMFISVDEFLSCKSQIGQRTLASAAHKWVFPKIWVPPNRSKSSISIGSSCINHLFGGIPIYGKLQMGVGQNSVWRIWTGHFSTSWAPCRALSSSIMATVGFGSKRKGWYSTIALRDELAKGYCFRKYPLELYHISSLIRHH